MEEMIMPITKELLDQLLQEYEKPEDLLGDDGVLHQLTKALVERALEGEMTHHLGYAEMMRHLAFERTFN
jgi:transposase-like protein